MAQDYLQRFLALTQKKADAELIRRWEWDARFYGDENIKKQLATAKRTATSMLNATKQFSNLKPEHEAAIKTAAGALRALVAELTSLAAWAKDYGAFCKETFRREADAELEVIAQERWGQDVAAVQFEADLMREIGTQEGRFSFGQWVHSTGRHLDVKIENIAPAIDRLQAGPTERAQAALTVQETKDRCRTTHRWNGMHGPSVVCSWADYEAYLIYRKEVAQTSARIVQMARHH